MLRIVPASDVSPETIAHFLQPIYAAVYPNQKYGLRLEDFSLENFLTPDTLTYLRRTFKMRPNQVVYLAYDNAALVGCISLERRESDYELHGYYVALDRQGEGIGKALLAKALGFYDGKVPICLEVAETSLRSIAMYEKWGFRAQPELGVKWRHWPEWPEGVKNPYIYMQLTIDKALVLKEKLVK